MKPFNDVIEIARYFSKLSDDIPFPEGVKKPSRNNYSNNQEWGKALDEYESGLAKRIRDLKEYKNNCQRIEDEFKQQLFKFLEIEDNPKAQRLYEIAWDFGHSTGYNDVAIYAEQLAELLEP